MTIGSRAATPASPHRLCLPAPPATAVAYLVSQYPKISHAFIEREIRAMRALGVTVHTFSVRPVPDSEVLSEADRADRARTPVLLAQPGRLGSALLALLVRRPLTFGRALRQALRSGPATAKGRLWQLFYLGEAALLVRRMREAGVQHVHVHLANNSADVARLASTIGSGSDSRAGYGAGLGSGRGRRAPWTWSLAMHGPTEFADVIGTDLAAKVRSAAFVACISDYCRSQLMTLVEPEHWSKLHVVRMAVDPKRYPPMLHARQDRPADRPTRVVFVGRLVPEKGPMLLLDALASAPPGSCEVRIVGDGPLRAELAARISRLRLDQHVTLMGALGQDDLPAQYGWADVFCLPSLAEGLPVVLMEAMATGLPVLTTRITGIPELVRDGENGLLVSPGRADELAAALARLHDPVLRTRLGTAAVTAVHEQHDAGRNAVRLRELLG